MKKVYRTSLKLTLVVLLAIGSFSLIQAEGGGTIPTCANGGCYAASCSINAGFEILGVGISGGYSLTCVSGAYACCNFTGHCFPATWCPPLNP